MGLLTDCDHEQTSILDLIKNAEDQHADSFDVVYLSLDSGRELILVAITAEYLEPVAKVLDGLREMREE